MANQFLKIKRRLVFLLPQSLRKNLPGEIAVVSLNTKESKRLNYLFRGVIKETNVLSFRYGKDYGELLLCPEIIKKEAKGQGHSYKYQMTWMILHGMIHLAGLHHESSSKTAMRVAKIEDRILSQLFAH